MVGVKDGFEALRHRNGYPRRNEVEEVRKPEDPSPRQAIWDSDLNVHNSSLWPVYSDCMQEHREPGLCEAYGAEDDVYAISSEDEVGTSSSIATHRVTRRTKRLQDAASSATDARMASGSARQPV